MQVFIYSVYHFNAEFFFAVFIRKYQFEQQASCCDCNVIFAPVSMTPQAGYLLDPPRIVFGAHWARALILQRLIGDLRYVIDKCFIRIFCFSILLQKITIKKNCIFLNSCERKLIMALFRKQTKGAYANELSRNVKELKNWNFYVTSLLLRIRLSTLILGNMRVIFVRLHKCHQNLFVAK